MMGVSGGSTPGSSFITTLGTMFLMGEGGDGGGEGDGGSPGSCFTTTLGVGVMWVAVVVVVVVLLVAVEKVLREEGMSIVWRLEALVPGAVLEGKRTMRWLLAPDSSSKGWESIKEFC